MLYNNHLYLYFFLDYIVQFLVSFVLVIWHYSKALIGLILSDHLHVC